MDNTLSQERGNISTPGDFLRIRAKKWLALPGVKDLPEFYKISWQVVENGDPWLRKNSARDRKVQDSPEVRLFLITRGSANLLMLMHEAQEAAEPEVRQAARKALAARSSEVMKLAEPFVRASKAVEDVVQRFDWLGREGWTVPLHIDMPSFWEFHRLISRPDASKEEIERWFTEYYLSGGLAGLSKDLTSAPCLSIWERLIQQCLQAFGRRDYQICLPSLILIFDGVMAKPWGVALRTKKKRKQFFHRKTKGAPEGSAEQYIWKSVEAFTEQIFEDNVSEERPHRVPKRNLILHGKGDPNTWNAADCLRLFQGIFTIAHLHGQFSLAGGADIDV